jgi:CcmD family protein
MRLLLAVFIVGLVGLVGLAGDDAGFVVSALTVGQPAQPPQPPPGFEPMTEVPASEQIPAFRLVAVAYMFVWVVLFGYVLSLVKRQRKVEQDLHELEQRRT